MFSKKELIMKCTAASTCILVVHKIRLLWVNCVSTHCSIVSAFMLHMKLYFSQWSGNNHGLNFLQTNCSFPFQDKTGFVENVHFGLSLLIIICNSS